MSALGPEWDAVFSEPMDIARVRKVLGLLGPERWDWAWSSPVLLKATNLGDHAVADALQGLGRDETDQGQKLGSAGWINLVFRRHDAGQAVDGAAQLIVVQVLQLVRQQDDQHVFMRRQCAGDLWIGFHSCCAPPRLVALVARGPSVAHRNRKAIFSSTHSGDRSRTAFARAARLAGALYRAFEWLGDLVAGLGARVSRRRA